MRPSQRRKIPFDDEPSPSEKRELMKRGEWEEEEEGEAPNRAPLVFRLLAWTSLIVIFFAVGYGATSLAFKWLDKKAYESGAARTPENLADTPEEAQNLLSRTPARGDAPVSADLTAQGGDAYVTVTISIPDGNSFKTRQIRCSGALREDTIKQTLAAYMDVMKEGQILSAKAQELNIFQSGEWLYLNMSGDFLESIKTLGAENSRLMLTGLVKTMSDNFPPVNKIKFYIDGKEVRDKKPVDLTSPWGFGTRS
jgi:flagellar basal body-associated protein FliL